MAKDISRLIDESKQNLAYYLDASVYIPVKEELVGIEHSLGVRKELFKSYIDSELERLKTAIIEYVVTNAIMTNDAAKSIATSDDVTIDTDDKKSKQEE
jgi:hypothetical protein